MMNETLRTVTAVEVDAPIDPLEELPVAYVELDAKGTVARANRVARSIHSSHCGELIGKSAWELMPTDEREQSCATLMAAMQTGEDPPVARRSIYTSSGAYRVLELHRNLIRDTLGNAVGMRVVTVDVTEADKALKEAERARVWLESVLASIPEAVIVTDALGLIRTANPAAEELLGWKTAELIAVPIERMFPVVNLVSNNGERLDFAMVLESRTKGVATLLNRDGRELQVEVSTSPIIDRVSGVTVGVVSLLRRAATR